MLLVSINRNKKQYTQLSKIENFIDPFLGVVRLGIGADVLFLTRRSIIP